MSKGKETGGVKRWKQDCFLVISDVEIPMPFIHGVFLSERSAELGVEESQSLPEHLIENIRVVPAELHFDTAVSQEVST